ASAAVGALTLEQLELVQARARNVSPRWREKFMRAVGDQLASTKSPTNRDILEICAAARRAITVGIGVPDVGEWGACRGSEERWRSCSRMSSSGGASAEAPTGWSARHWATRCRAPPSQCLSS